MPWLTLAWKFRRYIGIALAAIAIIWAFLAYRHSLIEQGDKRGAARVQTQFDAFKAKEYKLATDEIFAQRQKLLERERQAQEADNVRTQNEATIAALRARPAVRLRCVPVEGNPGSSPVPTSTSGTPDPAAGTGVVPEATGFDPTGPLRDEAVAADRWVETLRETLAKWPK